MRRYVREVFPEQPDPTLIVVLHEEHLRRLAWSVLFPTEEEATQRRTTQGMPSILEQEWAAMLIAEYSYCGGLSELLVQQMKAKGTDGSRRADAHYTPRDVISLFYPEIPSDSPSVASTFEFSGEAKELLLRSLLK